MIRSDIRTEMFKKSTSVKRVLVIKLRHHGDSLLITPVINTLKANYPAAEVDVLLYKETEPMLQNFKEINHIYAMDRNWRKEGTLARIGHEWRLLKALRSRQYDMVINLADQWYSAIVTRFTGATVRATLDLDKRQSIAWKMCFTHLASMKNEATMHIVEQNLNALAPLALPATNDSVTMAYAPDDWTSMHQKLLSHQVLGDYILVQPTSRWFFKCWNEQKMAEVIKALAKEGHQIVVTSGPESREVAMVETILQSCQDDMRQGHIVSLAGKMTLPQLAALIDHAKLYIGVDSVPMHMAAALKTPLIALFGPSKLNHWRPWQAVGEIIWAGDYCQLPDPDDVNTNSDIRYLDSIPTSAVLDAARRYL